MCVCVRACVYVMCSDPHHIYLDRLSPKDEEVLCSLHHESHELFTQDLLYLVCLKQAIQTYENSRAACGCGQTCLMAMENRMELMELSMSTLSFSLRLTTTGVKRSSRLLLRGGEREGKGEEGERGREGKREREGVDLYPFLRKGTYTQHGRIVMTTLYVFRRTYNCLFTVTSTPAINIDMCICSSKTHVVTMPTYGSEDE